MTQHHFETHEPVNLYVEIGKGAVNVTATETTETHVERHRQATPTRSRSSSPAGRSASSRPHQRAGFFNGDSSLHVVVTVPDRERPRHQDRQRRHHRRRHPRQRPGQDRLRRRDRSTSSPARASSRPARATYSWRRQAAPLRIKSGSGDVTVRHAEESVTVSTGSGDVEIGTSNGPAVVKTGSGDLWVEDAGTDVSLASGSGDLTVGRARRGKVTVKGASGDVQIGIPAGTPVWTDLSTVSGVIHSNLEGVGQPEEGADHIELRAKTVSGDIVLRQV